MLPAPIPQQCLAQLGDRERTVLERRFGLNGRKAETLADIGASLAVTRERIRQIEAKSLRILRTRYAREFNAYLEQRRKDVWGLLSRATFGAAAAYRRFNADKLTPEDQLSMAVLNFAMVDLVKPIAREVTGGWAARDIGDEALHDARRQLKDVLAKGQLPAPLARVCSGDPAAFAAAIETDDRVALWSGYLARRPLSRRARRTIRVHRLLVERADAPVQLKALHALYRTRHKDDQCSTRDLLIVMGEARHLFLNLYEAGWTAFGSELSLDSAEDTEQEHTNEPEIDIAPDADGATTVAGLLRKILRREGPLAFDDLRDRFMLVAEGIYSRSSVGPILLLHSDFVRFAPGIYGLEEQLRDTGRVAAGQKLLLDERQLTLYCQARWAREPQSLYPLWTPAMERAWAEWAYGKGLKDHLQGLLTVAEIKAWPTSGAEQARWIARRQLGDGFHLLSRNPLALTETVPSCTDVLRVAVYARHTGGVSWMSANRVRGLRIDDRHAHSVLAFLAWLGILRPASHWQAWHEYEPQHGHLIEELTSTHRDSEGREWPRSFTSARTHSRNGIGGWLDEYDVALLIERMLGHKSSEPTMAYADVDDLDTMMKDVAMRRAIRSQGLA